MQYRMANKATGEVEFDGIATREKAEEMLRRYPGQNWTDEPMPEFVIEAYADMESKKLVFCHDSDGLDYISAFAYAIKPFGLWVKDLTKENGDTIDVVVTNIQPKPPEKEWSC